MIEVDWTWLTQINLFQIAVGIVAIYIIARLLMRFWPWLRKVMALTEALSKLPAFMARTDDSIEVLRHQVQNDHDTNLRDDVTDIQETLKQLVASDGEQWEVLEHTIPRDERGRFIKKED